METDCIVTASHDTQRKLNCGGVGGGGAAAAAAAAEFYNTQECVGEFLLNLEGLALGSTQVIPAAAAPLLPLLPPRCR